MKNTSTWEEYLNKINDLLASDSPEAPYNEPDYFNYLKLNESRQNRWLKTGKIKDETRVAIESIQEEQTWYLITEPWCGDASQLSPFIYMMSQLNPKIELKIVYRDTEPFMIDNYLTNGGKAIPKLVIRNKKGEDLFVWGPRPKACQDFFLSLKEQEVEFETIKIELQKWYNKDKGESIQEEFIKMFSQKS